MRWSTLPTAFSTCRPMWGRTTVPPLTRAEYAVAICSGEASPSPWPTAALTLSPIDHGRRSERPQELVCSFLRHLNSSSLRLALHPGDGKLPGDSPGRSTPDRRPRPYLRAHSCSAPPRGLGEFMAAPSL